MRFLLNILIFSVIVLNTYSQDAHFSQSDLMSMYFNPAATGFYNGFYRANVLHRQQWNGIGKGFVTSYASFDAPIFDKRKNKNKAGIGGFLYLDKAGDSKFKTTQVSISYSGQVKLASKHFLSGGIQFSYIQKSFDLTDVQWVNQYNGKRYDASINPNEITNTPFTTFIDVGIGGRYEYHFVEKNFDNKKFQQFSIDVAMFHATEPILQYVPSTNENLKNKLILNTQYIHDFETNSLGINVYGLYMKQYHFEQWMAMFLLRMRTKRESQITGLINQSILSAGIIYRSTGFIIPNIRLQFSHFEMAFCYDAFISIYQTMPRGMNAFEIQISYSKYRNSLRNIK